MRPCSNCNSSTLYKDENIGSIYCTTCGAIEQENIVTSSLQFTANSTLQGQIIQQSSAVQNTLTNMCVVMCLSEDVAMQAFRWYKLGLQYNLSKGRSIVFTLSACTYLVCRLEQTNHLLIDFTSVFKIDSFAIGKVFLRLIHHLNIKIPLVDPSLYINKYVTKLFINVYSDDYMLAYGKQKNELIELALKLVQRMKRDWIVAGRRPNNICGAAILIASRILGINFDITLVSKTVGACSATIRVRLKEISDTETASLTIQQFHTIWLEREADPPCMKRKYADIIRSRSLTDRTENEDIENQDGNQIVKKVEEEEEEFVEIEVDSNDSDIRDCIVADAEVENRRRIWEDMYGEFLEQREKKHAASRTKRLRKTSREKQEKGKSSKINYDVIQSLFM